MKMKKFLKALSVAGVLTLGLLLGAECNINLDVDLAEEETNCAYGFVSEPLTAKGFEELIDGLNNGTIAAKPIMYYHLKQNCVWSGDLVLPDGVSLGLCCFKSTLTFQSNQTLDGVEVPPTIDKDLYVYDCTEHGCYAAMDEAIPLTHSYIDFATVVAKNQGGTFKLAPQFYVLNETFDCAELLNLFADPTATSISYCNGYQATKTIVTVDENNEEVTNIVDGTQALRDAGVTIYTPNQCIEPEAKPKHNVCFEEDTIGLSQAEFDYIQAELKNEENTFIPSADASRNFYFTHLTGSVTLDEPLDVPDGLYLGICTNGYRFTGKVSENVYVYDCTMHACETRYGEEMFSIWQSYFDLKKAYCNALAVRPEISLYAGSYALMEDVDVSGWTITFPEAKEGKTVEIVLCTNGHTVKGLTLPENVSIVTCDCARANTILDGAVEHACSELAPHISALEVTADMLAYLLDFNTGEFIVPGWEGEIALALAEDIVMPMEVIIPRGTSLHICLNGHKIGANYGKPGNFIFTIEYGAEVTICDCSATQTGLIFGQYTYQEQQSDGSYNSKSANPAPFNNMGKLTINSGILASGAICVTNYGHFVMNGGALLGAIYAYNQDSLDAHDYPLGYSMPISEFYGGVIIGGYIAVSISDGDAHLQDISVMAMYAPIAVDAFARGTEGECVIHDVDVVFSVDRIKGFAEALGTSLDSIERSALPENFVAIQANAPIKFTGDFNVIIDENLMVPYTNDEGEYVEPYLVDFVLTENATIEVVGDDLLDSEFFVALKTSSSNIPLQARVVVDRPLDDVFVAVGSCVSYVNTRGELVFVPISDPNNSAVVKEFSLSTDGVIQVNFYCSFQEEFINNSEATILVGVLESDEVFRDIVSYSVSDLEPVAGDVYLLRFGVAAKDYQKQLAVGFADGKGVWLGTNDLISIEMYLNYILSYEDDPETTEDDFYTDAKEIALSMLNYCNKAAIYFNTLKEEIVYFANEQGDGVTTQAILTGSSIATYESLITAETFGAVVNDIAGDIEYKAAATGSLPEGVRFVGASLLLDYNTSIRFYFTGSAIKDAVCTVNGFAAEIKDTKGGYYIEISNISVVDLSKMQVVCVGDYTIRYSALSYSYAVLVNAEKAAQPLTTEDQKLVDVAKGILLYWAGAYRYFCVDNTVENIVDA